MTNVTTQPCPHCAVANPFGSAFCESCGKALPQGTSQGPRIITRTEFAGTAAGQRLQGDELQKQARKASGALLAVAIIQTVVCAILIALASSRGRIDVFLRSPIFMALAVIAAIFWGLYIWARKQPLPAAIVGLVLYVTLVAVNVITSVSQLAADPGAHHSGFGGVGIGWLDIVIIAVLGRAIAAATRYRKLLAQQSV
jgi:hypothetical protein